MLSFVVSSCASYDGRQAAIDSANKALTNRDCTGAIAIIEPWYNSENSNDEVRMVYASAHGCNAGINFFEFVGDLLESPPVMTELWTTIAKVFYSNNQPLLDKRIESTRRAIEALLAVKTYGAIVAPIDLINPSSFNPGSLLAFDRTADSNFYNAIVSMASIGALQSRYSDPDSATGSKGRVLGYTLATTAGWADATNIAGDGCQFAASLLNMVDSIEQIAINPGGNGGRALADMISPLTPHLPDICNAGCRGNAAAVINGETIDFSGTGCAFADDQCEGSGARACPVELRNRASCTGVVSNRASCAAAGIARFVNEHTLLGWPGP